MKINKNIAERIIKSSRESEVHAFAFPKEEVPANKKNDERIIKKLIDTALSSSSKEMTVILVAS